MYQVITRNIFSKCYSLIRFQEQFRISSCLCKSTVRLKSDVPPAILKNGAVFNQTDHVIINKDSVEQIPWVPFPQLFVDKCHPKIQPYLKLMRIDRPIGTWLLFWPSAWSISMAAPPGCLPDPYMMTLFGLGSLMMRGAGCTINDMWDRDIDSKVKRTSGRPLVNGSLSYKQAWVFLAGQLSLALLVLCQLNWYSIALGASSLGLVAAYPLAKRVTYWPQMVLGLTINWGVLLGYSAIVGHVYWPLCAPLYIASVCWTIVYDTIYAHQDVSDDLLLGIKSTAIKFKDNSKQWLSAFSAVMAGCLTTAGIVAEQTLPYYGAVGLICSHLAWQIYTLDVKDSSDCGHKFTTNYHVGFILFMGIVLGNILKENKLKQHEENS